MSDQSFSDVDANAWYAGFVQSAYQYGIVVGIGDGTFRPEDKITREQAMTMIRRAMGISGLKVALSIGELDSMLADYADGQDSSEYARNGIAACVKTGIVYGRDGKLLAPKAAITRAEVAVMVKRLLKKSGLI